MSTLKRNTGTDAERTCAAYFDAWTSKDGERFRRVLAEDVRWEGAGTTLVGPDDCMKAFHAGAPHISTLEIVRVWSDGDDVLSWIEVAADGDPAR